MGLAAVLFSNLLLFLLVFGMAATVEIEHLKKQLSNRQAFCTGLFLQFVVLPFLGFIVVFGLRLQPALGITLLVVTSSPGGSYSNWWCSLFNADLALSVAMTAVSTICSVAFLPMNLLIYASLAYDSKGDVVKELDWRALFISLTIVIFSITSGLLCSARVKSPVFNIYANRLGNMAGISLILVSTLLSSGSGNNEAGIIQVWHQSSIFYLGVAAPCVMGLITANLITTHVFKLAKKPERVTVSIECCYQNVGIATSVAISMFEGEDRAVAMSVPLFYGIVEAITLGFYCVWAWKMGWTKAPKDDSFCRVITNSYEVEESVKEHYRDNSSDDGTEGAAEMVSRTPPLSPDIHRRERSDEADPPSDTIAAQANHHIDLAMRIHGQNRAPTLIQPPNWIV